MAELDYKYEVDIKSREASKRLSVDLKLILKEAGMMDEKVRLS